MAYCTKDDLTTRLGAEDLARLADHDGDGEADDDVIARAIDDAEALMDSYLGARYSVPVEREDGSTPDALRTRAVDLAVYFLCLGRDSVTTDARAQHEEDIRWLDAVAAGRVTLGVVPAPAVGPASPGVRAAAKERLFGRDEPL